MSLGDLMYTYNSNESTDCRVHIVNDCPADSLACIVLNEDITGFESKNHRSKLQLGQLMLWANNRKDW